MERYKYILFEGRWGISITIYGQVYSKNSFQDDCIEVCTGLWLSFSKYPLSENEIFCEEDRDAIYSALDMVKYDILSNSQAANGVVIQICSLQYSVCFYQKEAMIAAMINWCSKVFDFESKEIKSKFDKKSNKYIFDFSDSEK